MDNGTDYKQFAGRGGGPSVRDVQMSGRNPAGPESEPGSAAGQRRDEPPRGKFPPFTGSGVCDVCNAPLGGKNAYIVPNDVFYASPKYREHYRKVQRSFTGITIPDSAFAQMRAMDHSVGSAVCEDCIYMFEESVSARLADGHTPQTPPAAPARRQGGQSGGGAGTAGQNAAMRTENGASGGAVGETQKKKLPRFIIPAAIAAVVLIAAVSVFGFLMNRGPSAEAKKILDEGVASLSGGENDGALEQFLRYIDMEPEDENGYLYASEAYIRMDDIDGAVNILNEGYGKTESERIRDKLDRLSVAPADEPAPPPDTPPMDVAEPPPPSTLPEGLDAVVPEEGEYLYTGILECAEAEEFRVSFILSADMSYIYGIRLEIIGFEASVQSGNRTTTIEASNVTETFGGEYPIDFGAENTDISIGMSTIRSLSFGSDVAVIELDYVYHNANTGNSMTPEVSIPIGTVIGELYTETAPVAGASAPPSAPGTDVFPVHYEAFGNTYSVTGYTVGSDADGNTVVTLWGDGYGVLHIGPEGITAAAACKFETGGETFECTAASVDGNSMVFNFGTSAAPELITVINGDTADEVISFFTADVEQD